MNEEGSIEVERHATPAQTRAAVGDPVDLNYVMPLLPELETILAPVEVITPERFD